MRSGIVFQRSDCLSVSYHLISGSSSRKQRQGSCIFPTIREIRWRQLRTGLQPPPFIERGALCPFFYELFRLGSNPRYSTGRVRPAAAEPRRTPALPAPRRGAPRSGESIPPSLPDLYTSITCRQFSGLALTSGPRNGPDGVRQCPLTGTSRPAKGEPVCTVSELSQKTFNACSARRSSKSVCTHQTRSRPDLPAAGSPEALPVNGWSRERNAELTEPPGGHQSSGTSFSA
jgi:hypothetical protein